MPLSLFKHNVQKKEDQAKLVISKTLNFNESALLMMCGQIEPRGTLMRQLRGNGVMISNYL